MKPSCLRLAVIGLVFPNIAATLSVTPGSQCGSACGGAGDGSASATSTSDIVCMDDEYDITEEGRRFKECVDCLNNSQHVNGSANDLSSLLFNFRFAVDTCLFDEDRGSAGKASEITGCLADDACLPLGGALAFDKLKEDPENMYGYCTAEKKAFLGKHTQSCLTCLHSSDEHVYLSNFLTVLTGGCAYKPEAGEKLEFRGDIFSHDKILIEAPDAHDSDTRPITPIDDEPSSPPSPRLSREFVVGIVVGVCILFAIAILLFFIYYLRFRKRDEPPAPDLFPHSRSQRHQQSIDPDPALFGGRPYPWSSDSDAESAANGAGSFDYEHAAAMDRRMEGGDDGGLPAHRAYRPFIRSKHRAGRDEDGSTVLTAEASNLKALEAGSV